MNMSIARGMTITIIRMMRLKIITGMIMNLNTLRLVLGMIMTTMIMKNMNINIRSRLITTGIVTAIITITGMGIITT